MAQDEAPQRGMVTWARKPDKTPVETSCASRLPREAAGFADSRSAYLEVAMPELEVGSSVSVESAMQWKADEIVRRYCKDHGVGGDEGLACFESFKQFLVVCATRGEVSAPSESVDDMWHTALLFTRSYREYCETHLGTFIHHEPVEVLADADVYSQTRDATASLFGDLDERHWPSADVVARCGGCASIYRP